MAMLMMMTMSEIRQVYIMHTLHIIRFALSVGVACAVVYLGCVFLMATASEQQVIAFFNSLLHGFDVEPVMQWEMAWWEMGIGVIQVFVLGWLFGALIASVYNVTAGWGPKAGDRKKG